MEDDLEDLYGVEVSGNGQADPICEAGDEQAQLFNRAKDHTPIQLPGIAQPAEGKNLPENQANLTASEIATSVDHDDLNVFEKAKIKPDGSKPSEEDSAKVIQTSGKSQDLPGNGVPQSPQGTPSESTQPAAQSTETATHELTGVEIVTRTNVTEAVSQSGGDMPSNRDPTAMEVDSKPESNDPANLAAGGHEITNAKTQESAAIKSPSQENVTIGEREWEADSSPYESSSDDSSGSSSSDSDDDEYKLLDPAEQARRLMEDDANSDEEGGSKGPKGGHVKTHNERTEEVVEKPDITITPDMAIEELGTVEVIVENVVVIKAKTSGEYQVLESRSLLCLADRTVIGVVSETLGRVQEPLYCVRFSTPSDIEQAGITRNTKIHYVPQHSTFVFTRALQAVKGSDASNIHDEEVGDDEAEFSDDEAEAEYKRSLKAQKQARRLAKNGPQTTTPNANGSSNGVDPSSTINYDDAPQDDLYTPLSRPANLHEMMDHGPTGYKPSTRGNRGNRGRGDRGHHRGRGDRGGMRPRQNVTPGRGPQPPLPHHFGGLPSASFSPQQGFGPASSSSAQVGSNSYGPPFPNPMAAHGYHQTPGPPSHLNTGYPNYYMPPQYANIQGPPQNSQPGQHGGQPHSGYQNSQAVPAYPPSSGSPINAQLPSGIAINPRFFQSQYPSQNGS